MRLSYCSIYIIRPKAGIGPAKAAEILGHENVCLCGSQSTYYAERSLCLNLQHSFFLHRNAPWLLLCLESARSAFHMNAETCCESAGRSEPRVLKPVWAFGLPLLPSNPTPQTRRC